jgi:hypothetical protein
MLVNYFTLIAFNAMKELENIIKFARREDIDKKIFLSDIGKT